MVVNPAGLQFAYDFGNPKTITGFAREAISGGQLVVISGAAASAEVSSGLNSFVAADIKFATGASGVNFAGIAMFNAGSNTALSVAVDGVFIVTAAGNILGGTNVLANGGDAVIQGTTAGTVIGRAYTSAGSEGYVLVHVGRV